MMKDEYNHKYKYTNKIKEVNDYVNNNKYEYKQEKFRKCSDEVISTPFKTGHRECIRYLPIL